MTAMRFILQILCAVALGLTVIPPVLFCAGQVGQPLVKQLMLAGTLLWFGAAFALHQRRPHA